jgi:hypothetical protein
MLGDHASVVQSEHFKPDCGTPSTVNHAPEDFGLKQMMIGVIVALAEKDKSGAGQTLKENLAIDEARCGDVPDAPSQRVISIQGRFPRHSRAA